MTAKLNVYPLKIRAHIFTKQWLEFKTKEGLGLADSINNTLYVSCFRK